MAWITTTDVPDPGRVWSALSGLRADTSLVPVLLDGAEDAEDYFFSSPADIGEIDRLDPATVLTELWQGAHEYTSDPAPRFTARLSTGFLGMGDPPPGGHGFGDILAAIARVMSDPQAAQELLRLNEIDRRNARQQSAPPDEPGPGQEPEPFPGLAPPGQLRLSRAERDTLLASLPPARIGLVPASRPADVPAITGWGTLLLDPDAYEFGTVLRSFEDRFGAVVLKLGPGAELRLLVDRPPRTLEHATQLAAEHSVFCNECAGQGLKEIPDIARALVRAPIWTFWWD